ncbi:MAG TPA: serine hydrolase domain-containing protein [Terriglobales bacterium]|nr:serine hydrolase domain-containing protein [Terriglobales bacterium]
MSTPIELNGSCDPRFNAVRDAFRENFETFGETGAAIALVVDGKPVVDLWAGYRDQARTQPWTPDTIVNVYSTTKGMTALCANRLADQGRLELDAPVAKYWPEFAQAGKETLPVRYLLTHQAGLPAIREFLPSEAIYNWETMTSALAAETPWWEPGTRHGYHAVTYGFLVGEVIRRITGRSLGNYFREEIAGPLGADFHIGLAETEESRVSLLIAPPAPPPDQMDLLAEILRDPTSMLARAFLNPPLPLEAHGSRAWRAAEIPAANGQTNARALARIYGVLANGGSDAGRTILSPAAIARAATPACGGPDALLPLHTSFGLGFMLSTPTEKMGHNPQAFGHGGMGGSMAFADPVAKVGFGYVINEMHTGLWLIDPRAAALIDAVYRSL